MTTEELLNLYGDPCIVFDGTGWSAFIMGDIKGAGLYDTDPNRDEAIQTLIESIHNSMWELCKS